MGYVSTGMADRFSALLMSLMALCSRYVTETLFGLVFLCINIKTLFIHHILVLFSVKCDIQFICYNDWIKLSYVMQNVFYYASLFCFIMPKLKVVILAT